MEANMWPNEDSAYRKARNRLLKAEAKLRAQAEAVAELRRQLPAGGEPKEDYVFEDVAGRKQVRLSQLFEGGRGSLFLYNFMFAPGKSPCPMCTSLLDALDGEAVHLGQRINLAAVAKATSAEIAAFARGRGWRNLRFLSSGGNTYNRDYGGENEDGSQLPMMHVWIKRGGKVQHFWASELFDHADSAWTGHPRHADAIWPLWNVLDLTPEGRGTNWYPKLAY
jgi:predicted dithiol-disulfide oxidoreductase (DUF899 family)